MKIQIEILVIIVHLFLSLIITIFILSGRSRLRKEQIVPLYLIPIAGIGVVLTIELMMRLGKQGQRNVDMERLTLDDDILWKTLKSSQEKGDLVPLEEAILIDDVKIRRRSMLETLYTDPFKYLDVINVAKYNDDIETSHYATTTIAKAQKDFQLAIQKHALEVERHPNDSQVLDDYIEILRKYIRSGLLEEHLLRNLRIVYAKALDRKLVMCKDDKNALLEKLRNAVELREYATAFDVSQVLRKNWPEDEQTWIETLRVCVEGNDQVQLIDTIDEMRQQTIPWTTEGFQQVSLWIK